MALGMSVAEAQDRIDSREFAAWIAYDRVEPFGERRADLRTAIVASVIANANRARSARPFTAKDFMPSFEKATGQSPEEMMSRLFQFAEIHNRSGRG